MRYLGLKLNKLSVETEKNFENDSSDNDLKIIA